MASGAATGSEPLPALPPHESTATSELFPKVAVFFDFSSVSSCLPSLFYALDGT